MARRREVRRNGWRHGLRLIALGVIVVVAVVVLSFRREGRTYRAVPPLEVVAGDRIVVEVLNGCGAWGAASHAAEKLREHGFDVVRVGNARDFSYPVTVVIDRSGSMEKAGALAHLMGCTSVIQQVAPDAHLDVTVILGADGVWRRGHLFPTEEDG